jgi:hypothetical protein
MFAWRICHPSYVCKISCSSLHPCSYNPDFVNSTDGPPRSTMIMMMMMMMILLRVMNPGRVYTGPLCPTSEMAPSFISRGTPHQPTREASISEGGNLNEFSQQPVILTAQSGIFYMPQSWDKGQIIWLPHRRKACWGFFTSETSDGFGRVWTRELGNQRPAC